MKPFRAAACLLPLLSVAAFAQRSNGYWFAAPGGATGGCCTVFTVHLGAGAEIALPKFAGIGIEAGALGNPSNYTDSVFGIGSVNGYFHPRPGKSVTLDPFVTGGYSLLFRRGTANAGNYGGGLNWWFQPSMAVRVELRDHVIEGVHFWGVRMGMTFTELFP
jgi:hypothetical protein